jgi:hypothetical protein
MAVIFLSGFYQSHPWLKTKAPFLWTTDYTDDTDFLFLVFIGLIREIRFIRGYPVILKSILAFQ